MSVRETKQDRTVRLVLDQVVEHIHELKGLESTPSTKELDVERWCQGFLKNCLGYTASAGYSIRAQESKGKMRPDLVVLKGEKPIMVVEVKKLGFDLNRSDFRSGKVQLKEYLHAVGDVRWGILSNGIEWRLFDFSAANSGIEIASVDIKGDAEQIDVSKKGCEELAWNFLDMHETSFTANNWADLSKEAMAFSPESLTRAVLSADVVKYIAKSIRGEHEYKANTEILIEKLYDLLANGLDDSIKDWNETKQAEMKKYLKAQKRIGRRPRKEGKRGSTDLASDSVPPEQITLSDEVIPDDKANVA